MSDIFISYAREDQPRAEMLAQFLGGRGWSIFWDRTIPIGKTWRETIGSELDDARCVIVLWSKISIKSGWVQDEADEAKRRGVLVPILIENVQPPMGFRSIQAAHLENWDGTQSTQALGRLVADIAALIGLPPKETESGRQVEAEIERKAEEERKQQEAAARRQAEAERQRREAEAKRRTEEEARQRAAEEERRKREAEMEQRRKEEAEAKRQEDEAQRRREVEAKREGSILAAPPRPAWQKSRPALLIGSLVGVVLIGAIGLWLATPPSVPVTPSPAAVTPTPSAPPTASPAAVAPTPGAPVTPSPAPAAPKTQSGPALAQRAVLYEEDLGNPQGKKYVGSAVWRTETVSPGSGLAPELQICADVTIPERNMTVTWSLRRNTDPTLPASHTIEIMFNSPPDFSGGGIANVPGVLTKESEQARGAPLAGLTVKVINGFFLIGLSAVDADVQHNVQLLKDRPWFDVPIIYNNGGRAILSLEKGPSGDRAFAEAFAAWDKKTASGSNRR